MSPAPHVTKRLFAVVVLMTGILCMFGGKEVLYLLTVRFCFQIYHKLYKNKSKICGNLLKTTVLFLILSCIRRGHVIVFGLIFGGFIIMVECMFAECYDVELVEGFVF